MCNWFRLERSPAARLGPFFIPNPKKKSMTYTDNTPMPWGKHKGKKLANVPADYLLWLYDHDLKVGPLRAYIEENMDALKSEIGQKVMRK